MQLLEALTFYLDQLEFMTSSIHGDKAKQTIKRFELPAVQVVAVHKV